MNIDNKHISIWGDSILKGVILDDADKRYKVLANNCVSRFASATHSVITNHASFGMTTGKAFERIKKALERNCPSPTEIVLLEFGGNDCDYHWEEISAEPERQHEPKTPINVFENQLQSIISLFQSFRIQPIQMTLPPLEPFRYFEWISRNLDKNNILKWLGDINKIYRWQEAYNQIVIQTAQKNSLALINVRQDFLVSKCYTSMLCSDGIHPSEAGHNTILDTFLSYVHSI